MGHLDPTDEPASRSELEIRFDAAMMEIYGRAADEVGYRATRYLQMLRRRGGLATARRLLQAKATSDGYARLREAGRLDLTVESYALRPEFQPLFTLGELRNARDRLAAYHRMSEADGFSEPDPMLLELVDAAGNAPADRRVELYRDRVAAYGPQAIAVMMDWVEAGRSPGFAIKVIETVGLTADSAGAVRALQRLRIGQPDWAGISGGDRPHRGAASIKRRPLDLIGRYESTMPGASVTAREQGPSRLTTFASEVQP